MQLTVQTIGDPLESGFPLEFMRGECVFCGQLLTEDDFRRQSAILALLCGVRLVCCRSHVVTPDGLLELTKHIRAAVKRDTGRDLHLLCRGEDSANCSCGWTSAAFSNEEAVELFRAHIEEAERAKRQNEKDDDESLLP